MSYNLELSELDRASRRPLTQQLVEQIAAQIDGGALPPGGQLPTTRALAAAAGVNHLTAARVYRKLAELGYVTASVGRGTFVRRHRPALTAGGDDDWQLAALPPRRPTYGEEMLRESLRTGDDVIPMATGFVDGALSAGDELAGLAGDVIAGRPEATVSYLPVEGLADLRERLAALGRAEGFATGAHEILVTTGARQALDLVARTVLVPGDVAVVESPTFVGTLTSLRATGAQVLDLPVDEAGADVDALERILARHEVKLVAVQTAGHNPTGADLSPRRRARLVELAREHGFFVLKDGVYGAVRFGDPPPRRLRADAPAHVIYVDSLSKTVGAGLRLGWLAAGGPVLDRLTQLKMDSDVHTAGPSQVLALEFLRDDRHARLLDRTRPLLRARRDALLAALERHLAGEATWTVPAGGHHLWVTLRGGVDQRALYAEAVRCGVSFLPGDAALAQPSARACLRLSFCFLDGPVLEEGVRRLARALAAVRRRRSLADTAPIS